MFVMAQFGTNVNWYADGRTGMVVVVTVNRFIIIETLIYYVNLYTKS